MRPHETNFRRVDRSQAMFFSECFPVYPCWNIHKQLLFFDWLTFKNRYVCYGWLNNGFLHLLSIIYFIFMPKSVGVICMMQTVASFNRLDGTRPCFGHTVTPLPLSWRLETGWHGRVVSWLRSPGPLSLKAGLFVHSFSPFLQLASTLCCLMICVSFGLINYSCFYIKPLCGLRYIS